MPKKQDKKSGDKPQEANKTLKKESFATAADKTLFDDHEKNLYLTQIQYLTEQLERFQLKCDKLEKEKKDFNLQYSALETEKKDIVEYLKCALLEKEEEVDELAERLESQQRAADEDRDALQQQHSELEQELQERIEELTTENTKLATRFAGLEEFQSQKEQLMSNMESVEKQLTNQMEEHKAEIYDLEEKQCLEKNRLEKEMESHMAAVDTQVQCLVDRKILETTRLALQENEEVNARLVKLSKLTQTLMKENFALQASKIRLSLDVDNLEQMLSKISCQNCITEKVVEQLTEKCRQLQAKLKDCEQEHKQLQTEHTGVLAEMETLRQDRASLSEQCKKNMTRVSRLKAKLQGEKSRMRRIKNIMPEAALYLRHTLMEAPTEQSSEADCVLQWKQLIQKLLLNLDRPTVTNSLTENDQLNELPTSDPAAARAETPNPALSFQFDLPCSRIVPVVLGFAPRPQLKQKVTLSRPGVGSSSTHMLLHRKPSSQKTAGSVNPTASTARNLPS